MEAKYHHSSCAKGYVSVKNDCYREDYKGRFGVGYIIHHANLRAKIRGKRSNVFHKIDYYIYD